jgi:hypothetical protein
VSNVRVLRKRKERLREFAALMLDETTTPAEVRIPVIVISHSGRS